MAERRSDGASRRPGRPPRWRTLGFWAAVGLVVLVGAYLAVLEVSRPHVAGERLRLDQFHSLVEVGRVRDATLLDEDSYVEGTYSRDDGRVGRYNTPLLRSSQREVTDLLLSKDVPTTIDQQVGKRVASLASVLLPGLIVTLLFVYLIVSYRQGSGLFSVRSGARRIQREEATSRFHDVAGQDAAVAELTEVRDFLADQDRFTAVGASAPKGILLVGPPGCGKTLLARALAGEAAASFFSISGSDFVELYVGVGAARVRDLFAEARRHAPAVVFIDELDSIGRARGGSATDAEQEKALNQILTEMDGFSAAEGVVVLAATNRPDVLDQALLRPGRFDRTVALERPDEQARRAVLALHARQKPLGDDADLDAVARAAIGLTGADLAALLNEAAILAARMSRSTITQADLDQALRRLLEAPERQRRLSMRPRGIGRRSLGEQRASFSDLAGADDAVAELSEVRDYLAEPDRFARLGARVPRGILLSGPPGSGKTLLARAVAGEANAAFYSVAASEFVQVFVGQGAARVRELFAEAAAAAPAIVFIDEIDAIGARRGAGSDGGGERDQTLNQILVELDGFEVRSGLIVVAATNRPDILDAALTRPGRFDRHITVGLPDRAGRAAIVALHLRDKPGAAGVDPDAVSALTPGLSGADLANILNEAALLAARRGMDELSMALVEECIDRATSGVVSRGLPLSERQRAMMAYHAAGHAVVGAGLRGVEAPQRLSILGGAARVCGAVAAGEGALLSRTTMVDHLIHVLAGRAAEELVFGDALFAAVEDLERAGVLARVLVSELGMSGRAGLLAHASAEPAVAGRALRHSEETTRAIEHEIVQLLETASGQARSLLLEGRPALDLLAQALLDRERLSTAEVEAVLRAPDEEHRRVAPAARGARNRRGEAG